MLKINGKHKLQISREELEQFQNEGVVYIESF